MIEIRDLHYTIKQKALIQSIDLSIQSGELIAIVGPNGAGKSTLLSCLSNELKYKAEQFSFKNKDIESYKNDDIPKLRAKFSQHQALEINLKNNEIVLMGRYPYFKNDPSEADWETVDHWMQKTLTQHLVDRDYEHLSGGEKQRLHLARVFAQLENDHINKLILLDEPLNNLDVTHQFKTLHLIKEFTQKKNSALVVLHDLNLAAQFADKLLLMNNGKIDSFDTPENVLTQERISQVYQYPCTLTKHPLTNLPIILFG